MYNVFIESKAKRKAKAMFKGYTRKQAGVIFSNYKRGNIQITKENVNTLYNYADWCSDWMKQSDKDYCNAIKAAVQACFDSDYDKAQSMLDHAFYVLNLAYED